MRNSGSISKYSLKNSLVKWLIPLFVTIFIFYLLLRNIGLNKILFELREVKPGYILCAFMLSLIFVMLSTQKWKMLMEMTGYKISFLRCQKIAIATYVLNVLIPSKGGDFVKCISLRDTVPLSKGIGIVILERLIDIGLLCVMAFTGSFLINSRKLMLMSFAILFLCFVAFIVLQRFSFLNFKGRFSEKLENLGSAVKSLRNNKGSTIGVLLIGSSVWLGSAIQIYLLYKAVNQSVPLLYTLEVTPMVIFIGLIPITIAGMGTRDAALIYLFSSYSTDSASITVGVMFSLLRYWILALLGIPFLRYLNFNICSKSD